MMWLILRQSLHLVCDNGRIPGPLAGGVLGHSSLRKGRNVFSKFAK